MQHKAIKTVQHHSLEHTQQIKQAEDRWGIWSSKELLWVSGCRMKEDIESFSVYTHSLILYTDSFLPIPVAYLHWGVYQSNRLNLLVKVSHSLMCSFYCYRFLVMTNLSLLWWWNSTMVPLGVFSALFHSVMVLYISVWKQSCKFLTAH